MPADDPDIVLLLTQPVPRMVSRSDVNKAHGTRTNRLLMALVKLFVLLAFVTTTIIAVINFPWHAPIELLMHLGWNTTADGIVTDCHKTSERVRLNNSSSWQYVYEVAISFPAANGKGVTTRYYVTGDTALPSHDDTVPVVFFPPLPYFATGPGGNISPYPWSQMFIVLFPLASAVPLLYWYFSKRRTRELLTHGQLAIADIAGMEGTGTTVNGERVYRFHLSFSHSGFEHQTSVKARGLLRALYNRYMDEGRKLILLFLPENPHKAMVIGLEPAKEKR